MIVTYEQKVSSEMILQYIDAQTKELLGGTPRNVLKVTRTCYPRTMYPEVLSNCE